MIRVDKKYILLGSSKLRNFKQVNDSAWRFSCNYCGDSLKNPKKTRGNIYMNNYKFRYKCFNCGVSKSISEFIKDLDPNLHSKYEIENYKEGSSTSPDLSIFGSK